MKDLQNQLDSISAKLDEMVLENEFSQWNQVLALPAPDLGRARRLRTWRIRNNKPVEPVQPSKPSVTLKGGLKLEALDNAYRKDYNKLYSAAWHIVKDAELARDIVHDAIIKAMKSNFSGKSSASTFIFRIIVNQALDVVRSKGYKASAQGGAADPMTSESRWVPADIVPRPFLCPERALLLRERAVGVQAALNRMKPAKRQAFTMHAFESASYKEVASTMGVKLGTVMSRINAARAEVRRGDVWASSLV